jgi:histidine decarboxylase
MPDTHLHMQINHQQKLDDFIQKTTRLAENFLGYQTSQQVQFDPALHPLLNLNLLNLGDAYTEGNFRVNAKEQERAVLDFYARHWHATNVDTPNRADSYWGYVTTMGSTEGNLFGLWNARDYLSGGKLWFPEAELTAPPRKNQPPVLLTSRETHYSVAKAAHILGIALPSSFDYRDARGQPAPNFISSDASGAIAIDELAYWAELLFSQGHPLIFALNIGTTFKGGFDPIKKIIARLPYIFNNNSARNYWIHVDAAICGNTLPWIEQAQTADDWPFAIQTHEFPSFDFRIPQVCSICASPYKWIGAPFPFGVYLTRGQFRLQPPVHPKYIGSPDSTFSGSRSGLACVYAWHYFSTKTHTDHLQEVTALQKVVDYAYTELKKLEGRLHIGEKPFQVFLFNTFAPMICFTQPNQKIIDAFSLASEDTAQGTLSHMIILKQVTTTVIDHFIISLKQEHCYE